MKRAALHRYYGQQISASAEHNQPAGADALAPNERTEHMPVEMKLPIPKKSTLLMEASQHLETATTHLRGARQLLEQSPQLRETIGGLIADLEKEATRRAMHLKEASLAHFRSESLVLKGGKHVCG